VKAVLLERMTWPEAKDAFQKQPVCIVPVGAVEQHGHHLPMNTDSINVYELARRAAEQAGNTIVAPVVNVGVSWNHINFPGTLSLRVRTLMDVLTDVCVCLARHGAERIILLNGHGGNISAVQAAADELREEHGLSVGVVYTPFLVEHGKRVYESTIEWHADEAETSSTLYLNPDSVRMDRAVNEHPKATASKFFTFEEDALAKSVVNYGLPKTETITDSGTVGDAKLATRAKGEVVVQEAIENLVRVLQER
jgi:creatinine amidohydrolase